MTTPDDLQLLADSPGVPDREASAAQPPPSVTGSESSLPAQQDPAPSSTPSAPDAVVVRVPTAAELGIQHQAHGPFTWRWTYQRSADSQKSGAVGQDYLTFQYGDDAFTFALCDGVGQSYFGDLAASLLGDSLAAWLWHSPWEAPGLRRDDDLRDAVKVELARYLATLVIAGTERVQQHQLPDDLQPMLRTVLEQKRAEGSAATFVAGRLDAASETLPNGRIVLVWTGDSRVRLWNADGEFTAGLENTFVAGAGWSTRLGLVGDGPHVLIGPLHDPLTHLSVYSDGLAGLNTWDRPLLDAELQDRVAEAQASPTSDDIALLDVWLNPRASRPSPPSTARTAPPVETAGAPAPIQAMPLTDDIDDAFEPVEDEAPTLRTRRPRRFELTDEDTRSEAEDLRADDDLVDRTGRPTSWARQPEARRPRRRGGPSLQLVVAVLVLGILFGLIFGLGVAWLFGYRII
ncbi:MAG: hypothetical protein U0893_27275 [Chloroflexota bacterium]